MLCCVKHKGMRGRKKEKKRPGKTDRQKERNWYRYRDRRKTILQLLYSKVTFLWLLLMTR